MLKRFERRVKLFRILLKKGCLNLETDITKLPKKERRKIEQELPIVLADMTFNCGEKTDKNNRGP